MCLESRAGIMIWTRAYHSITRPNTQEQKNIHASTAELADI